jgi:2'-5' RNA ligase
MPSHIAIVAYPRLNVDDQRWIESVRAEHDPQAHRIGAHVTLVFPCVAPSEDIVAELATIAATTPPVSFHVVTTEAMPDAFGSGAHVFLRPDDAAGAAITRLHARLYEGALRPHLRTDIPFIPHITVAAADLDQCRAIAVSLRERSRVVRGSLDGLVLLDIADGTVKPLFRATLTDQDR